jgi:hypothetical protein
MEELFLLMVERTIQGQNPAKEGERERVQQDEE